MIYYTVDRKNTLNLGQKLELTKTDTHSSPNFQFSGFFSGPELVSHINELFPEGLSKHGWDFIKQKFLRNKAPDYETTNMVEMDTAYILEMNLEYTRRIFYAEKPSRFQSIFAWESIEDARKFKARFPNETPKIFAIEGKRMHKADMHMLLLGLNNASASLLAHKHWKSLSSLNPYWEIALELPVHVIDIIE